VRGARESIAIHDNADGLQSLARPDAAP